MIIIEPSFLINSSPLVKTYTLEEFFDLPEPTDHSKLELIHGVLYMSPMPDWRHSTIITKINQKLFTYIINSKLGGQLFYPRAGIKTGTHTWVEPDLFYLSSELLKSLAGEMPHTADIVIEVLSLSTEKYDKTTKADTYEALDIRELWLVDPQDKTIEIRENLSSNKKWEKRVVYEIGDTLKSKVLEGFELLIDEVFES
jgi:Uma2 family endonuclease